MDEYKFQKCFKTNLQTYITNVKNGGDTGKTPYHRPIMKHTYKPKKIKQLKSSYPKTTRKRFINIHNLGRFDNFNIKVTNMINHCQSFQHDNQDKASINISLYKYQFNCPIVSYIKVRSSLLQNLIKDLTFLGLSVVPNLKPLDKQLIKYRCLWLSREINRNRQKGEKKFLSRDIN